MQKEKISQEYSGADNIYPIAIPYFRANDDTLNHWASELNITFVKNDSSVQRLYEFSDMCRDKHINITFPSGIDFSAIEIAMKANPEIYVRLSSDQFNHIGKLQESGIKYYFEGLCDSWEALEQFAEMGFCAIYPAGDLMHSLNYVHKYCEKHNMKVRSAINKVNNQMGEKACIYLPGTDYTDGLIDIFEFDIVNPLTGKYNLGALEVLVKTYFIKKRWSGDLSELIQDLDGGVCPDLLIDYLYNARFVCGMACVQRCASCNKCAQVFELANKFGEKNVRFAAKNNYGQADIE